MSRFKGEVGSAISSAAGRGDTIVRWIGRGILLFGIASGVAIFGVTVPGVAGAGDKDSKNSSAVVAQVGDLEIRIDDVRSYIDGLPPDIQQQVESDPAAMARIVRTYAARMLVLNEARADGWEKRPEIQARLARLRDELIVNTYLAANSTPPKDYPSDAEIQAAYDANQSRFMIPRQYHIAQIFIALPKGADKAAQDKAKGRLDAVQQALKQKSASFEELAKRYSDDSTSTERGGDLGWLSDTQMMPEIRTAVAGLGKGDVSSAIRLEYGWHIVKLVDTQAARVPTLGEVRETIAQSLRAHRQLENEQAFLTRLMDKSPPAVNELVLPQLLSNPPK